MSERRVVRSAQTTSSRVVLVCCAAWLSCLCLACGFGGEDDVSEISTPSPSPPPAPPPTPPQTLAEESNAFVCREEHRPGLLGVRCYVRQYGREIIVGGPVGTRVTLGSFDYTLTESDRSTRSDLQSRYPHRTHPGLSRMDVVAAIEYPREPFFEHLSRVCGEGRDTVVDTWTLRVEQPGEPALEAEWPITVGEVSGVVGLHLSLALDESNAIELPPVTGDAILYEGECFGGPIRSLSDIRYKATTETQTRRRPCGTYQNSSGERARFGRTMLDQQVAIVELRTGRRVRQGLVRASTPNCPRTRRGRAETVYSHVDRGEIREWFERQIARL